VSATGPIQALIFDIGQVIVRVNPRRAAEALAQGAGTTAERVLATIEGNAPLRDMQEGRLSPREWHKYLSEQLGLRLAFERFCDAWNSALDRETIVDENLFAQLGGRYPLVLLSNTDPIHVAYMEANFRFPSYFLARVYSCAVGASKPAQAIYQHAIVQTGVEPRSILYVDDSPDYVEAGGRAGMQTHRFKGAAALLAELRARRLWP